MFALSWVTSDNSVEITRAQGVIEAARAAQDAARAKQIASQGLSDVGRGQTFILVLLNLVLVVLVGLVVYIVLQRQIWMHSKVQPQNTGLWVTGPNAHWKRVENPDPYQQLLLQQQLLLINCCSKIRWKPEQMTSRSCLTLVGIGDPRESST